MILHGQAFFYPSVSTFIIASTPITNVNIFENEQMLTNRLFYVVTDFYENKLRVLIFYEENVFLKEKNDELMLVQDIWGIQ